jgi:hypothetical protein
LSLLEHVPEVDHHELVAGSVRGRQDGLGGRWPELDRASTIRTGTTNQDRVRRQRDQIEPVRARHDRLLDRLRLGPVAVRPGPRQRVGVDTQPQAD